MAHNDAFSLLYGNLWVKKDAETIKPLHSIVSEVKLLNKQDAADSTLNEENKLNPKSIESSGKSGMVPQQDNLDHTQVKVRLNNSSEAPSELKAEAVNKELITSWDKLTDLINNCTQCKLCNSRKNLVIERGNHQAPWMFIGEAPGENEDLQGLPFVGAAGQLLDKMIAAMQLDKEKDVYICNTVKCRPPQNRNPEPDEISSCNNYLLSQIHLVKPKFIVILGRIAAHTLLKTTVATAKLRGQIHYVEGNIPSVVTYHPAYLLRNPAAKKEAWEDLQLAIKNFATL